MCESVFEEDGVVVEKLFEGVLLVFDVEGVGQQGVPVVERVEFSGNAVLILELLVEEELGVELEFEVVTAQVLHVVLDHDLDGLSCCTTQSLFVLQQTVGRLPDHIFSPP